jgi:hypothetical protein
MKQLAVLGTEKITSVQTKIIKELIGLYKSSSIISNLSHFTDKPTKRSKKLILADIIFLAPATETNKNSRIWNLLTLLKQYNKKYYLILPSGKVFTGGDDV